MSFASSTTVRNIHTDGHLCGVTNNRASVPNSMSERRIYIYLIWTTKLLTANELGTYGGEARGTKMGHNAVSRYIYIYIYMKTWNFPITKDRWPSCYGSDTINEINRGQTKRTRERTPLTLPYISTITTTPFVCWPLYLVHQIAYEIFWSSQPKRIRACSWKP